MKQRSITPEEEFVQSEPHPLLNTKEDVKTFIKRIKAKRERTQAEKAYLKAVERKKDK